MKKKAISFRIEESLYEEYKKEYFKMLAGAVKDEEILNEMKASMKDTDFMVKAIHYAIVSLREVNKEETK